MSAEAMRKVSDGLHDVLGGLGIDQLGCAELFGSRQPLLARIERNDACPHLRCEQRCGEAYRTLPEDGDGMVAL
jgi:predicted transcriptional regulator